MRLIILFLAFYGIIVNCSDGNSTDVALNAAATASGTYTTNSSVLKLDCLNSKCSASKAVDSDPTTAWISKTSSNRFNISLEIDWGLNGASKIGSFMINFGKYWPISWTLETYDDASGTWNEAFSYDNVANQIHEVVNGTISPVTCKKIRLFTYSPGSFYNTYFMGIYDIQVFIYDPSITTTTGLIQDKGGSNTGFIVGIAVAAAVAFVLITIVLVVLVIRRKKAELLRDVSEGESLGTFSDPNSRGSDISPERKKSRPSSLLGSDDYRESAINNPQTVYASSIATPVKRRTLILPSSVRTIEGVKISKKLGSGNFGDVFLGISKDNTPLALKKLKNEQDLQEFVMEASTLSLVTEHPHVVQFYGIFTDDDFSKYIVLEYINAGSLLELLRKQNDLMLFSDLIGMVIGSARGMAHLEKSGLIHRDLACRNILVQQDAYGKYNVKISDFGMTRQSHQDRDYYKASKEEAPIPIKWSAPEVLERRAYSTKSDVWAFAITMWEIFECGKVPYALYTNLETGQKVMAGERLSQPSKCPSALYDLMMKCWETNPDRRPTFADILAYLEGFNEKQATETSYLSFGQFHKEFSSKNLTLPNENSYLKSALPTESSEPKRDNTYNMPDSVSADENGANV